MFVEMSRVRLRPCLGSRPPWLGEVSSGVAGVPGVGRGGAAVRNVKGTAKTKVADIPPYGAVQHLLLAEMVPQTHTALGNSCKGKWSHFDKVGHPANMDISSPNN